MAATHMTGWVRVPVDNGTEMDAYGMDAYVARPDGAGPFPVIVVGMELFGVGAYLREVAESLAGLGYLAIAPDFYHRSSPRADSSTREELDRTPAGRDRGFELLRQLTRDGVVDDVRAVLGYATERPDTTGAAGMVGFSLGGHLAYLAATRLPLAATAVVYGGWLPSTDIGVSRPTPTLDLTPGIAAQGGRVLFVVGGDDAHIPAGDVDVISTALRASDVDAEVVVLPGVPHAFFFAESDTYDAAAHDATWRLLRRFFAATLPASP